MKNKLYLIATIAFFVLSVDLILVCLFSDKNIEVTCDCPDFAKHAGHSNNQAFEDEVLLRESYSIQQNPDAFNDFIPFINLLFNDCYCSKVWQPPKIS